MAGKTDQKPSKISRVLGAITVVLFVLLLAGWIASLLWNVLVTDIFGLRTINALEAIGLSILVGLLFGGTSVRR